MKTPLPRAPLTSVLSCLSLVALTAIFSTEAGAAKIGVAAMVHNQVTGTIGSQTGPISVGNEIVANQRIQTGNTGTAQFLFADQSVFDIGPRSDLVLDRFVYDPNKGSGDVVLETTKGAFRFISGSQSPTNYKIQTPLATAGIRGSMIFGVLGPNAFVFYTGEGTSFVTPNGRPTIDNIPPGRAVITTADGQVTIIKFDVGSLDLNRLQQLLPSGESLPDGYQDFRGICIDPDRFADPFDDPDCD
jgi:hypothetical protein